jgi:hypothetical protein
MKTTTKIKKQQKKRAFVFTLDALLVLPLIILIISSLIAFSATLKENVLMHEYAYMIAKDSVNYMSELDISRAVPGLASQSEASLSVLDYTVRHLSEPTNTSRAITGALDPSMPDFAGYICEYKNGSAWVQIATGGNLAKVNGNYTFQVSAVKIISSLSNPVIPQGAPCSGNITCAYPQPSQYGKGEIIGPIMFRIRIFT